MTDPLSISAGVAGLLTTADLIFHRTLRYVQAIKGAGGEIAALSSELADLFGVLKNLETVAAESEQLNQGDSIAQWHHIAAYQLKWPFTKSATMELIAEIERHKST